MSDSKREAREAEGEPRQTVSRLPADEEVGPYFPSGMSAPEAALAGADADLDDDTKSKVGEARSAYEGGVAKKKDDDG